MDLVVPQVVPAAAEAPRPRKAKAQDPSLFSSQTFIGPAFQEALRAMGLHKMTAIQQVAIPALMEGSDACLLSKTGTGKTVAYLLPLVLRLQVHKSTVGVRAVIISPTRELGIQLSSVLMKLVKFTDPQLRVCLLLGGESVEDQFTALAANPDVIVATTGRLLHHLDEIPEFRGLLQTVEYLVFDECDQIFDQGLLKQAEEVLGYLPQAQAAPGSLAVPGGQGTSVPSFSTASLGAKLYHPFQTVMVSATMPESLAAFSKAKLRNPLLLKVSSDDILPEELTQQFYYVPRGYRDAGLLFVCRDLIPPSWKVLIFAATRHHCEYVCELLRRSGLGAVFIYGAMDQRQRNLAMASFRQPAGPGAVHFLVSTDLAARGVDIEGLSCVLNYQFPSTSKTYIHRGGRTARAGSYGVYVSLLEGDDVPYCLDTLIAVGQSFRPHLDPEALKLFLSNCSALGLEPGSMESLVGKHAISSPLNGMIFSLPVNMLDSLMEDVRRATENVDETARRTMRNALKQVAATRQSASSSSVERAKALVRDMQFCAYPFSRSAGDGNAPLAGMSPETESRLHDVLTNYHTPTSLLESRARDSSDSAAQAALRVRQIMEKKALQKQLLDAEWRKMEAEAASKRAKETEDLPRVYMTTRDLDEYTRLGQEAIEGIERRSGENSTGATATPASEAIYGPSNHSTRSAQSSFFMPQGRQAGAGEGFSKNVISDLLADDEEGLKTILKQRKFLRKWDSAKKRFVATSVKADGSLQEKEPSRAKTQRLVYDDNSGKWQKASSHSLQKTYQRWKRGHKAGLLSVGSEEGIGQEDAREALFGQGMGRKRKGMIERARQKGILPQRTSASKLTATADSGVPDLKHIAKDRAEKRARQEMQARSARKKYGHKDAHKHKRNRS